MTKSIAVGKGSNHLPELIPQSQVDLPPILTKFANYLRCNNKSATTVDTYTRLVRQALQWINKLPEEITQDDLNAYKLHIMETLDQNSVVSHIVALNHFLEQLGRHDLKLKAPRKIKKNIVPLTEEEVSEIFRAARKVPMDYAMLLTLYYGCLRANELLNLNCSDIDFVRQKLRINNGKGGVNSEIDLHPIALTSLREYIDKHRLPTTDGSDALFVSKNGMRITRTPVWERVRYYAARAGIQKRVYPHLFRHSAITHMAERGATIFEIQRQSRHKDIEILAGYVHPSEQRCRETYLRTIPKLDGTERYSKTIDTNGGVSIKDRELALLDALLTGKISEETYNRSLALLRKAETIGN